MTDKPKEECGICGIYGVDDASLVTYYGLHALQHRGQESAGMVVSDGENVRSKKGMGLVNDVFTSEDFSKLPGRHAIGHVRYSTSGASKPQNIQPLVVDYAQGLLAVAHNGNLTNARALRKELEDLGSIFQTGTDSEVIVHLMARPKNLGRDATNLSYCLNQIKGAYSYLFLTKDSMTAVCDPHKFRPLALGKLNGGYVVASETCALDILGAEFVRPIEPGEIVTFTPEGMQSVFFVPPEQRRPSHCIFEMIYFARPDSNIFGENVHLFRSRLGARLHEEHPVDVDMVISVPDSGNSAAIGYAAASGVPFQRGFIRNHYVGRTFIQPQQEQRIESVRMKLNVIKDQVKDQRVVVVDDSIIRGTTSKSRLDCLKSAGVSEVHMRISCPPCKHPCYYGIDFPSRKELIAANHETPEIAEIIGADSLGYVSIEGLLACTSHPEHWCHACFSGKYPEAPVDNMEDKYAMDRQFEE